mmetsp:Transcript_29067/g.92776  ORF Transcript_29067/g.92776 Transcript_29067/m.92776 type:complete len:249 (+) Transcript_29067:1430-2176(+)
MLRIRHRRAGQRRGGGQVVPCCSRPESPARPAAARRVLPQRHGGGGRRRGSRGIHHPGCRRRERPGTVRPWGDAQARCRGRGGGLRAGDGVLPPRGRAPQPRGALRSRVHGGCRGGHGRGRRAGGGVVEGRGGLRPPGGRRPPGGVLRVGDGVRGEHRGSGAVAEGGLITTQSVAIVGRGCRECSEVAQHALLPGVSLFAFATNRLAGGKVGAREEKKTASLYIRWPLSGDCRRPCGGLEGGGGRSRA